MVDPVFWIRFFLYPSKLGNVVIDAKRLEFVVFEVLVEKADRAHDFVRSVEESEIGSECALVDSSFCVVGL